MIVEEESICRGGCVGNGGGSGISSGGGEEEGRKVE